MVLNFDLTRSLWRNNALLMNWDFLKSELPVSYFYNLILNLLVLCMASALIIPIVPNAVGIYAGYVALTGCVFILGANFLNYFWVGALPARVFGLLMDIATLLIKVSLLVPALVADLFESLYQSIFGLNPSLMLKLWMTTDEDESDEDVDDDEDEEEIIQQLLCGRRSKIAIYQWLAVLGFISTAMLIYLIPGIGIPVSVWNVLVPALQITVSYFCMGLLLELVRKLFIFNERFPVLSVPLFAFDIIKFAAKIALTPIYYVAGLVYDAIRAFSRGRDLSFRILDFVAVGQFSRELSRRKSMFGFYQQILLASAWGLLAALSTSLIPPSMAPVLASVLLGCTAVLALDWTVDQFEFFEDTRRVRLILAKQVGQLLDVLATVFKLPILLLAFSAELTWEFIHLLQPDYQGLFGRLWALNGLNSRQAIKTILSTSYYHPKTKPLTAFLDTPRVVHFYVTLFLGVLLSATLLTFLALPVSTGLVVAPALDVAGMILTYLALAFPLDFLRAQYLSYTNEASKHEKGRNHFSVIGSGFLTYLPSRLLILSINISVFSLKLVLTCVAIPLDLVYSTLHFLIMAALKCCLPKALLSRLIYRPADIVLFPENGHHDAAESMGLSTEANDELDVEDASSSKWQKYRELMLKVGADEVMPTDGDDDPTLIPSSLSVSSQRLWQEPDTRSDSSNMLSRARQLLVTVPSDANFSNVSAQCDAGKGVEGDSNSDVDRDADYSYFAS